MDEATHKAIEYIEVEIELMKALVSGLKRHIKEHQDDPYGSLQQAINTIEVDQAGAETKLKNLRGGHEKP